MHKQLKNYPWDGLFAVLKACDMEIPADKKDFFELGAHEERTGKKSQLERTNDTRGHDAVVVFIQVQNSPLHNCSHAIVQVDYVGRECKPFLHRPCYKTFFIT